MTRDVPPADRECCWRDSATVHLLGALPPVEARAYEAHLSSCTACERELELAREVVARVDASAVGALDGEALAGAVDPAAALRVRERLLDAVRSEPRVPPHESEPFRRAWRDWSEAADAALESNASGGELAPGLHSISASDGTWEPIGIPGIEVKRLAVDARRRVVSMLVRMAAGTSYPGHRHAAAEECFVVSGDVSVGERVLRAGDYQLAAAGSTHGVQSTRDGCTLFIISSQDDQLV